jgi:hypothetical protein
MKYVILIRSNPDPWGHPTSAFTAAGREIPMAERERMDREFEELLTELSESGELVSGQAWAIRPPPACIAGPTRGPCPPMGPTPRARSSWPGSS